MGHQRRFGRCPAFMKNFPTQLANLIFLYLSGKIFQLDQDFELLFKKNLLPSNLTVKL